MNPGRIWAKSSRGNRPVVSLDQHVRDLQAVARHLEKAGWIPKHVREDLDLAIRWHDLGKVLPFFQIARVGNARYPVREPLLNVPHALASLLFIPEEWSPDQRWKILLATVAYHHWRESYMDILSRRGNALHRLAAWLVDHPETRKRLSRLLQQEFQENVDFWNESLARYLARYGAVHEIAPPPYRLYFAPVREGFRETEVQHWIQLSGWLQRVDHFASFVEESGESIQHDDAWIDELGGNAIEQNVQRVLTTATGGSVSLWQKRYAGEGNRVVIAPTGMGKTELGLLWASRNGKQMIYILPLRVATEQIYERFKNYVGEERVGLLHGDADLFLSERSPTEEEALRVLDLARHLSFPYLVATGDQFFPYVLRPPGYERVYAGFPRTALVMDEVQAYDPVASAMVVRYAEDVVRMGGRVLVITATLPGYIRKALEERLRQDDPGVSIQNVFEDPAYRPLLEALKRHRISVVVWEAPEKENRGKSSGKKRKKKAPFLDLESLTGKVVDEARKGKRVLVVANTIKRAREWYTALRDHARQAGIAVDLLHSGYTLNDRKVREDRLARIFGYASRDPHILVATQVVEASLDLDADVLFTELAPMDALVQRMGRVFRRYRIQEDTLWNRAENQPVQPGELPPEEPNVYVVVESKHLASGAGIVYDVDLLGITLDMMLGSEPHDVESWMAGKKKRKAEVWWKERFGERLREPVAVGPWSEVHKHRLVEALYDLLERIQHRHVQEFEDTLRILDAGYMSDRKSEAHRLFRRIGQVQGIPENRVEAFVQEVRAFARRGDLSYTAFKREVLAEFVVSAYPCRGGDERLDERLRTALTDMDPPLRERFARWVAGLRILPGEYREDEGYLNHQERCRGDEEDRWDGIW